MKKGIHGRCEIISSMKGDTNERIASVRKQGFISYLVIVVVFVLSPLCIKGVSAQKVLSKTGFENYTASILLIADA
ncbi:hypothetical protein C6503_00920 [Candidatus Poribacteria bacterium]|nr:MAG: hypothetical protein C6503_00920 [Candidatus Poribacteria bacterium]